MSALSTFTEKQKNLSCCASSNAIERCSDSLYVGRKEEDLYFVMERICKENFSFWSRFCSQEAKMTGRLFQQSNDITSKNLVTGSIGFKDSFIGYVIYNDTNPHELWILYASVTSVSKETSCSTENIEMMCTVSTSSNAPFVTHMGITRSTLFAAKKVDKLRHHPNISMALHSFGASVMKLRYPEKIYMLTTPMKKMEEIFAANLGKQNVHIGYDECWVKDIQELSEKCEIFSKKIEEVQTLLSDDPENEGLIDRLETLRKKLSNARFGVEFYSKKISSSSPERVLTLETKDTDFMSFKLKDRNGNIVLDLDRDRIQQEYKWYFEKSTTFSNYNNIIAVSLDTLAMFGK